MTTHKITMHFAVPENSALSLLRSPDALERILANGPLTAFHERGEAVYLARRTQSGSFAVFRLSLAPLVSEQLVRSGFAVGSLTHPETGARIWQVSPEALEILRLAGRDKVDLVVEELLDGEAGSSNYVCDGNACSARPARQTFEPFGPTGFGC